jgi:hypothetical protein
MSQEAKPLCFIRAVSWFYQKIPTHVDHQLILLLLASLLVSAIHYSHLLYYAVPISITSLLYMHHRARVEEIMIFIHNITIPDDRRVLLDGLPPPTRKPSTY